MRNVRLTDLAVSEEAILEAMRPLPYGSTDHCLHGNRRHSMRPSELVFDLLKLPRSASYLNEKGPIIT